MYPGWSEIKKNVLPTYTNSTKYPSKGSAGCLENMYMVVLDKESDRIICQGKAVTYKFLRYPSNREKVFLSTDNLHFFCTSGTRKYEVILSTDSVLNNSEDIKMDIPEGYNVVNWMEAQSKGEEFEIDVITEKEIDEECVRLVSALNRLEGVETVSSCSGHGTKVLQVAFYISSWNTLSFLVGTLPGNNSARLIAQSSLHAEHRAGSILFDLVCVNPGENAYRTADYLASLIERRVSF